MSIIDNIKNELMLLNDKFMTEAEDKYNFGEEHIKYVAQEALALAAKYDADIEIVELAAMLHDIALMAREGSRKEHHTVGAEITNTILSRYNYPQDRIIKVKNCVFNHRSSKNGTTIEELCVSDADILAHFDNIPMLFNSIFYYRNVAQITLYELKAKMKNILEHDYDDLSDKTKQDFNDRYKLICQIVLGL